MMERQPMIGEDPTQIVTVSAQLRDGKKVRISYTDCKFVGRGAVGVVSSAIVLEGDSDLEAGIRIAIKKVPDIKMYKASRQSVPRCVIGLTKQSQELEILRQISHPNIANLKAYFFTDIHDQDLAEIKKGERYLHAVLEYMPSTVDQTCRQYASQGQSIPITLVKLYSYQMFRALAYLHSLGIYHGDIKTQNLLIDPATHVLKLCDFGAAHPVGVAEVLYGDMSSMWLQAPEQILGARAYTIDIDLWAAGRVIAEMLLGRRLFPARSNNADAMLDIMLLLGSPTEKEISSINPKYVHKDHRFPDLKPSPLGKVFRPSTPATALNLISRLLVYTPSGRIRASDAMAHEFFDEVREEAMTLPDKADPAPALNDTSEEGSLRPDFIPRLPPHAVPAAETREIDDDGMLSGLLAHRADALGI